MEFSRYGNEDSFNDAPRERSQYELPRGGAVEITERKPLSKRQSAKNAASFEKHSQLVSSILHSQKMERLSQLF